MFAYIEGKIDFLSPSVVYLQTGGIGYEVQITLNTFDTINNKKECRLYTHLQIKEDAWVLYGFATETEKESFRKLIGISGVGGATARILLSSISSSELFQIIESEDVNALKRVKGIGAKTAQRIILELKGKLEQTETDQISNSAHNTMDRDALNALTGLGIGKPIAEQALKKAKGILGSSEFTVEEWIKEALKCL